MDLQMAFSAAAQPRKTKLDTYRESLSPQDSKALDDALASPLSHVDIARVLTAQGLPIGEASIRRERERRNTILTGL